MQVKKTSTMGELILMLIFLSIFVMVVLANIFFCRYIHWLNLIVCLLPVSVFLAFFLIYKKYTIDIALRIILNIILCLSFILFSVGNSAVILYGEVFLPVTDTHDYQHLLTLYGYPHRSDMAHFPSEIPAGANDVILEDIPGFVQGASHFSLMYKTDSNEINGIYARYGSGANSVLKNNVTSYDLGVTGILHEEIERDAVISDFDFFILDSQPSQPGDWNHGYTYGIAVSRQRLEVIYWSEAW